MSRPRMTSFEEGDYYAAPRQSDPTFDESYRHRRRVASPPPPSRHGSRTPAFLRENGRPMEPGPMVLRQRDVETYDRHRPTSTDSQRAQDHRMARRLGGQPRGDPRQQQPPYYDGGYDSAGPLRRSRSADRIRARVIDHRDASPDSLTDSSDTSSVAASSEASSPPPRRVVREPTVERDVITHYRGIDHGTVPARPPSPPPPPTVRPYVTATRGRETDIDVSLNSRGDVDVDVDVRSRSRSRHRPANSGRLVVGRPEPPRRRRARSAAPAYPPVADEGDRISSTIDARGRVGEAYGGATRDWAIVDVPPGTERVRMSGIGGGATDTAWTKYSGVRRTQFIPGPEQPPALDHAPRRHRRKSLGEHRQRDVEVQIDIDRRRSVQQPQPPPEGPPPREMWTEVSKDLVSREAIEALGYEYEDSPMFYYIMTLRK
ncbi:Conserved glutamic acid rich protein [Geosmithia morbida]|uniref:Conserved glutamic acid rich protein n=1 Tax=Geosmithia morbida TaxID=1094350 RepID=A0A9P5D5E5_9HYPO|nr:Conserved glutamic acid rich protein [Geosmithia morbida]KAF4124471.1 Conserved glutamic acid rich protein [Geosmithia morbida]